MEFDTFVICRVFMHCFGSFLFQAMVLSSFFSLQVFAFKGQNMKDEDEDVVCLHSAL